MARLIWTIILLLVALWVAGLALRILGRVINLLLVIALILLLYNLLRRRD